MKPTITEKQAVQQADDYVKQAASAFPPTAKLELQSANTVACDDPTDNGPKGRVTAGNVYWVRGLPEPGLPQHFDAFAQWLSQHDFAILRDERPKADYVWAENKLDGFRLAFHHVPGGDPTLGADSPCVWPNGTPAPTTG